MTTRSLILFSLLLVCCRQPSVESNASEEGDSALATMPSPYGNAKNILTNELLISDAVLNARALEMMGHQKILTLDRPGDGCTGQVRVYAFEHDTLFVEKIDCRDYGFRNDVYLVIDGSLAVARKFELQWDPVKDTEFIVTEKVISFNSGDALQLESRQRFSDTTAIRIHPDSVQQSRSAPDSLIKELRREIKELYIVADDFDG